MPEGFRPELPVYLCIGGQCQARSLAQPPGQTNQLRGSCAGRHNKRGLLGLELTPNGDGRRAMTTTDKQRWLLRTALKMVRAPSEEEAAAALETAVRATAGRKNPAKIRAAVSQAIRHAREHTARTLDAASFTGEADDAETTASATRPGATTKATRTRTARTASVAGPRAATAARERRESPGRDRDQLRPGTGARDDEPPARADEPRRGASDSGASPGHGGEALYLGQHPIQIYWPSSRHAAHTTQPDAAVPISNARAHGGGSDAALPHYGGPHSTRAAKERKRPGPGGAAAGGDAAQLGWQRVGGCHNVSSRGYDHGNTRTAPPPTPTSLPHPSPHTHHTHAHNTHTHTQAHAR